ALAGGCEVGGAAHGQRDRRQLHGLRGELRVHVRGLGQSDVDVVAYETLVADGAHAYRVRAADLEALDEEQPGGTSARAARVARAAVYDLSTGYASSTRTRATGLFLE